MARAVTNVDSFQEVGWARPALLRGNKHGAEPLGATPWEVWRWLAPLSFLLLSLLSILWAVRHIEGVLESSAAEVLVQAGIPASGLTFDADYRDLEVSGQLPEGFSSDQIEQALTSVDSSLFNARTATVVALAPTVQALVSLAVEATSDGVSITLTGIVPDQAHKDALVEAAGETGLVVEELITVAGNDGASPDADGQINKLASTIESLRAGTFTTAALGIGDVGPVNGEIFAFDSAAAETFESISSNDVIISAPATLGTIEVVVNYDGARIILDGTVLLNEHSSVLDESATAIVGPENVVNNLIVSNLEPATEGADGRVTALAESVATFGGLSSADATINDSDITVNGVAFTEDARSATNSAVDDAQQAGMRPGGVVTILETAQLPLQEQIDRLQGELDTLQEEIQQNVVFDTNVDTLTPAALATLDRVVEAMKRYPLPVVEIGGHTDDRGSDELNTALSQARADSVAAYVGDFVDPGRLAAVGFGESQPIAEVTTNEGRSQNRRVEFIAKESF